MPRAELLELSRSCYHTVLARVSTLLTGLRVVATAPPPAAEGDAIAGDAVAAIPVSLPGSKLFAVLPHLLCPGVCCNRICQSSFGFGKGSRSGLSLQVRTRVETPAVRARGLCSCSEAGPSLQLSAIHQRTLGSGTLSVVSAHVALPCISPPGTGLRLKAQQGIQPHAATQGPCSRGARRLSWRCLRATPALSCASRLIAG